MGCQEVPNDLPAEIAESATIDQTGDDELTNFGLPKVQNQITLC